MKLRLDFLEYLTADDLLEEASANTHRYSAESVFYKTDVGFLKSATEQDKAAELVEIEALIKRLNQREVATDATVRDAGAIELLRLSDNLLRGD